MTKPLDWSFLKPWFLAIGPYLSVEACGAFARVVVRLDDFLGPRRPNLVRNDLAARLCVLCEALELLSLALHNCSSSSRHVLIGLCGNADLMTHFVKNSSEDWKPQFAFSFQDSPHGDCHDALTILHEFGTQLQNKDRSDVYRVACARLGSENGAAQCQNAYLSISLTPALKDTSNFRTRYLTAPTCADTIQYYEALYAALKALSSADGRICPQIHGLELDLGNLETPAHAIQRLGDILALGMPIKQLKIQLGYSWDAFDQAKLVSVINSTPNTHIDHLVIAVTTCDNLEAALESFPLIKHVHHIELVDRVLYGHPVQAFSAAFKRALLSQKKWHPIKLTLRGTHFEGSKTKSFTPASVFSMGLEELAVHLESLEVDAFLRVLPQFGCELQSLEMQVTHEQRKCEVSLQAIARACPQLRRLNIHGALIRGLGAVPAMYEQACVKWVSLVLRNVSTTDLFDLTKLAQALGDPATKVAGCLLEFTLVQQSPLREDEVDNMYLVLTKNKRLEYLELGQLDEIAKARLAQFDGEPMCERKYAFLSAVYHSTSGNRPSSSALGRVDSWNLTHIMKLAGLTRRRRIVLS